MIKNRGRVVAALLLTLFLAACNGINIPMSGNNSPASTQTAVSAAIEGKGNFREYPLPQGDDGLMRPAIDREERIWFGEMARNKLAVFDPRTHSFRQITPPHGQYGIMGVAIAADDSVWFAEQYADYIGDYSPASGQFKIYPLPSFTVPDPSNAHKTLSLPSAPNDVAIDAQGNVWFTEINAGALGKIDPHTGRITQYPLAATIAKAQQLDPYGIAVDPQGMIWFTEVDGNRVGQLDPRTGAIRYYKAHMLVSPMEIASDQHGRLWITSFANTTLLSLDARTGRFTGYDAPHTGTPGGVYGVAIDQQGNVWATLSAQNAIAQLDMSTARFVAYPIPTAGSLPLGIVPGTNHTLWFTEAGSNMIGMLQA